MATMIRNWHPKHMRLAMDQIQALIKEHRINAMIEMRDARIPISGANERLDFKGIRNHLTVYNKTDLTDYWRFRELVGEEAISISCLTDLDSVKVVLSSLNNMKKSNDWTRILIVGMPNVGKSSLINRLKLLAQAQVQGVSPRKVGFKTAVPEGKLPGTTRHTGMMIRLEGFEQPMYVLDTPGITLPEKVIEQERAIKIGLTSGGIFDELLGQECLVKRLFGVKKLQKALCEYLQVDILEKENLLKDLALQRFKTLLPGGRPNIDRTCSIILRAFREGKLGRACLD